MSADKSPLEQLRAEFPKGTVGILPKPYKKDSPKGKCAECGGSHGLPAVHLDFVGHAAVTDRLLSVDPEWNWEPMALDERGLPALDKDGNLWVRLTVCGVTRLGVGDGFSMKERIGDAIRNAAMRFGVALSLWSKDELESGYSESKPGSNGSSPPARTVDRSTGEITSRSGKQTENGNGAAATPEVDRDHAVASERPETSPAGDPSTMSLQQLVAACGAAGLPTTGGRKAMADRLAERRLAEDGDAAPEVDQEARPVAHVAPDPYDPLEAPF